MTATASLSRLNDLLIDLGRSLLQYTEEAWPWSCVTDAGRVREVVSRLAARQRASVQALVDYLNAAGHPIDFGIYPDEYSSLHYVSLTYLVGQLVVSQQGLVFECEQTARDVADDSDAALLVGDILAGEREALRELQQLVGR